VADTILVVADLAPDLIEAGRTLLAKLDAGAVRFEAAFWLMDPENGSWRLHLGASSVRESGSLTLCGRVDEVLTGLGFGSRFWIGMVTIEDMRSKIAQALVSALGSAASVDGARLDNATIGGIRVPACLLYRLTVDQRVGVGRPAGSPRRRPASKARQAAVA
jgi:hypothetical protein